MKKDLSQDFQNSAKGVLRDYRKFIPFFLVAFIIEALFFSLFMIGHSVNEFYEYVIREKYDYHYIVEGLDEENYSALITRMMTMKPENKRQVSEVKHEIYKLGSDGYHRLYITLKDTSRSTVNAFIADVKGNSGYGGNNRGNYNDRWQSYDEISYSYSPTPLMNLPEYIGDNNLLVVLLWLAVTAISIFLLVSVYNVRISHYRFMYGVYMTCGAGFRKLVVGALFEMLIVFAISLAPAFIASCIAVSAMFSGGDMPLIYISPILILALLSSLLVLCVAIVFPMKKVSEEMPIDLITKGGTAEYVTSPKRSANLFSKKFPVSYELLSVRRFAKYYVTLLIMCVVFNSLFVVGIYAGQLTETVRDTKEGTFTVTASNVTDDMLERIAAVEGVDYAMWEVSSSASENLSFIEMLPSQVQKASAYTVDTPSGKVATIDFDIEGYNAIKFRTLISENMASVTGDVSKLFLDDGINRAVISRDIAGVDTYGIEVGDTVTVCVRVDDPEKKHNFKFNQMMTNKDILSEVLDAEKNELVVYERYELEVCAIIDYAKPLTKMILGVSPSMYENIMGQGSYRVSNVEIYTPDGSTDSSENKAYNNISRIICSADDWNVERTYASFALNMASNTYIMGMFITVAILVLTGAPVLWLFSQKVFYEKRESEVTLLYRMGAGEKRLLGMFFTGGAFVAAISFVVSMVLSYIASVALLTVVAWILPFFGFQYSWMLTFEFELWTLLFSAAVCMVCGFISSLWAYYEGKRERVKNEFEYQKEKREGERLR